MTLKPFGDQVVAIELPEQDNQAGIKLARASKDMPDVVQVIAVGKDVEEIKVGMHVALPRFNRHEITLSDKTQIIVMQEKHFLGEEIDNVK